MCVAHFQIITKHIVIRYLQARNAGTLRFPLLNLQQIILSLESDVAQFVQFRVHPIGNYPSLVDQQRRIVLNFAGDTVTDGSTEIQLPPYPSERLILSMFTGCLNWFYRLKSCFQLHHITRGNPPHGHFGNDALQVAHQVQLPVYQFLKLRFAKKIIHHVKPLVDALFIPQRKQQPTPQQPRTHRSNRMVYHTQK